MMYIRPVEHSDHDEILALAHLAGIGMTSLPPDENVLNVKINRSVLSFAGTPEHEKDERFLFAIVDSDTNKIVGTTGMIAHVGVRRPFYSYKLSTIVQASQGIDVYSLQKVLHMVNDYTGATELGSLFLLPEYRRDGIGKFLSRSRHLVLAEFPEVFSDIVISEIRGVQDKNGDSPFYRDLAQHFFQMEFQKADFINATQGGQFIADLMPKYPIYVALLSQEARDVIGLPLEASRPAKQLLEAEGFRWEGYIDVFDAGPTLQAERNSIRAVVESRKARLGAIEDVQDSRNFMVCNTTLSGYRAVSTPLEVRDGEIVLPAQAAELLNVGVGDAVRCLII